MKIEAVCEFIIFFGQLAEIVGELVIMSKISSSQFSKIQSMPESKSV